jgi:predicted enzyme related to lactoylglutathione lyase
MKPQGLRTVIYPVEELEEATSWWSALLDQQPYFNEPFYVGFEVGGDELGLLPGANVDDGAQAYWGVDDVEASVREAVAHGAEVIAPPADVGGGIVTALVRTPHGAHLGLIFNPNHPG